MYAKSYETLRYVFHNINVFSFKDMAFKKQNGEGIKIYRSVGSMVLGLAEINMEWDHKGGQARVDKQGRASTSKTSERMHMRAVHTPLLV
jgi:hypothetical protein